MQQKYPINPRLKKRRKTILSFLVLLVVVKVVLAGTWQIKVVRQFFGQAGGTEANLIIDVTAILGPMPRPWRNLAQGGEDHNWRIGNLTGRIAALKPEYIRLDHIYDFYDIVQGSPGQITFNWTKFDLVIDDILKTGAKPYISLSYMPPAISSGDILAYPSNWADWQLVVQKTIEHISGTRGIRDVYYEVWNEPDLFGSFKYYGDKNYLTLYAYASAGAQNARGVLPFKLGGPANTALYKNWFNAFCQACVNNQWRCDFFSWHRYTTNLDQYAQDMQSAKEWIKAYPQLEPTMEFQITEWGHNSDNNAGYDSQYGAAHTVAAAIAMMNNVQRAFAFEIQDGKDPTGKNYWGRWGLFTHNDFGANSKPRYRALKMLDSIADQRLQLTGSGSFVKALAAKNDQSEIEIIIANFDPKSSHSELVPITFINIEPGSYTLNEEFLGGSRKSQQIATSAAALRSEIFMPINEVAKVTLIKN